MLRTGLMRAELTQVKLKVVRGVERGLTNVQIAHECFLSANTVKTHLSRISRKLGAHGRAQIVARAQELGIL